jgi:hypothetical protein
MHQLRHVLNSGETKGTREFNVETAFANRLDDMFLDTNEVA